MTRVHDSIAADDSDSGAPSPTAFRFQVPPEFQAAPLGIGEDKDAFGDQLRKFARDYWGEREDLEQLHRLTTAMYEANAETLVAGGTVHNALGIFPIGGSSDGSQPPERVSRATLTVSVRELVNPDPRVTAAGIAESLNHAAGDGHEGETQLVTLPAGPAVVRLAGSRAVWELPDGEQERFFVRIEVWLPFPGEARLLLLCLSTADVQDLYLHQAVLAEIADTVQFGETDGPEDAGTAHSADSASPFSSY